MPETRTYHGRCHCGAVTYEATSDLGSLMDCNCSRCRRLGWVMQPVPAAQFRLVSGEDRVKTYQFNTHRIEHLFCTVCGIESYSQGRDKDGNVAYMINVNCLEDGPEVDRSTIMHWDGRSA